MDLYDVGVGKHLGDHCFGVGSVMHLRGGMDPAASVVRAQHLWPTAPPGGIGRRVRWAVTVVCVREHGTELRIGTGGDRRLISEENQLLTRIGVTQATAQRFAAGRLHRDDGLT
jgi:hypothetical protein